MGSEHAPLILIELVLVFGSVLVFAWWQLRSLERDRKETLRQRESQGKAGKEGEPVDVQGVPDGAAHDANALPPSAAQAPRTTSNDRGDER